MDRDFGDFRIYEKVKGLPYEIIAGVLYGSWAKGMSQKDSDFDLLIVANGIHPRKNRRSKEIAAIKRGFSLGLPLDILLLTPDECFSNFKNHNLLFLDICEGGIILFDKENVIKPLIEETRNYLPMRGIEKLDDGWKFPVSIRTPSYLSKISQKGAPGIQTPDPKLTVEI